MSQKKLMEINSEVCLFLFQNALRSIPFNIVIAGLLSIDIYYFRRVPTLVILSWFLLIVIVSVIRWIHSKVILKRKSYLSEPEHSLFVFSLLTFFKGCIWGGCYAAFLPYVSHNNEAVIILILGGMAAGGVASLSAYMPAYLAYMLPMFLPVVIINYSFLNLIAKCFDFLRF